MLAEPAVAKSSDDCAECGYPLDPLYRNILITIHENGTATSSYVCFVCQAMNVAADSPYFQNIQAEEERRKKHIRNLKPGANYLD